MLKLEQIHNIGIYSEWNFENFYYQKYESALNSNV